MALDEIGDEIERDGKQISQGDIFIHYHNHDFVCNRGFGDTWQVAEVEIKERRQEDDLALGEI